MKDNVENNMHRVRLLAGWSYLGIVIPIVGIILGTMSLSRLKSIPDTHPEKNSLRNIANGGIIISIVVAIIYTMLGFWLYNMAQSAQEEAYRLEQQQQTAKEIELNSQRLRQTNLDICLQSADTAYWEYIKLNATSTKPGKPDALGNSSPTYYATQYTWDSAAASRQTAKDECYRRAAF